MSSLIEAQDLSKRYRHTQALDRVSFRIGPGRIVGLIGPNGAGKTSLLKALLGLTTFEGRLEVLGLNPQLERRRLMQEVSFIADVAVLPPWLQVGQAVDFVQQVHPQFDRARCEEFLARTKLARKQRVKELSKGMIVQLHLALIMAINARLLVLDEPTLGLDLLYRKTFYQRLLEDYFDQQRTILIATHQVEEIEPLLSDVIFLRDGRIALDADLESLHQRFAEVLVNNDRIEAARALQPLSEREVFGQRLCLFDGRPAAQLIELGEIRRPSVSDLFVALMQGTYA